MQTCNIKHRLTTVYHPQANGLDERFNQTLINSLAKFVQDDRQSWDEHLGAVVYSYNSAFQVNCLSYNNIAMITHSPLQESTKHTPFEAMYGRIARLPVDINSEKYENPDIRLAAYQELADPNKEDIQEKRECIELSVKKNIAAAQKRQKKHYDKIHRASECFTVS
jgi:hypothetical protein